MSEQTVHLSRIIKRIPPTVHAVQGDTGRTLRMIIDDEILAAGTTAELCFIRPNGTEYDAACTLDLSSNSFTADMTQGLTQSGVVRAELAGYLSGKKVSSFRFFLEVQASESGDIDHIDLCYILLGWNMCSYKESEFKEKAKAFLDLLIAHNPNIKIVLVGIQMPFYDGLGFNYGTTTQHGVLGNYRALQEFVYNVDKWHKDLSNEHKNNITSINLSGQFDTEHGTSTRDVAVNVRSTTKATEQSNGLHPNKEGYYQIADAVYRKFIADLA